MAPPDLILPPRLVAGDAVAVVSPSSWPESSAEVDSLLSTLTGWGLQPQLGDHAMDRRGYMAGDDADRVEDLNLALRDPAVRAVVASRGGCGGLRLVRDVDRRALERDPKPLIGYSDITALHRVWLASGVPAVHGAAAGDHRETLRSQLMDGTATVVEQDGRALTASLNTAGRASGVLVGGNLEMLARTVGVVDTPWDGCILLIEANRAAGLGMVDRAFTQLRLSGALGGIAGVAVGSFDQFAGFEDRGWTILDTLHDLLDDLGVPILGGLPLGHVDHPVPVPLGVPAVLDAGARRLEVHPLVR